MIIQSLDSMSAGMLLLKGEFATSAPTEQFLPISLPYWVTAHITLLGDKNLSSGFVTPSNSEETFPS